MLLALAGGAGSAAGQQMWTGLSALVRRPFGRGGDVGGSGESQLLALEQAPDEERARDLAAVLTARAEADPVFAQALAAWRQETIARMPSTGQGDVHSTVWGGRQNTVVTGRDFSGPLSFGTPPSTPDDGAPSSPSRG
ncbi:hypothetical protein [Streptomyces sp. NRRL S-118]|uniref:hypothetical protein n=1 Tax=Streptomyces sp. NRRL S-118 TaxID=1463881 RepID=UPI001F44D6FA|nr:hypothetical protein [Streptomyces sp. NRRL S-118]